MGDKKVGDNICLCGCKWSFIFFMTMKLPQMGDLY